MKQIFFNCERGGEEHNDHKPIFDNALIFPAKAAVTVLPPVAFVPAG